MNGIKVILIGMEVAVLIDLIVLLFMCAGGNAIMDYTNAATGVLLAISAVVFQHFQQEIKWQSIE